MGSIPARAGEPRSQHAWRSRMRVYPRACGGTKPAVSNSRIPEGLSPRVRGNRPTLGSWPPSTGSIPARAGEPNYVDANNAPFRVYPRACGGTTWWLERVLPEQGLSPRVRGNHIDVRALLLDPGSIPARAGEPINTAAISTICGVYPRACGGTIVKHEGGVAVRGLSPRVRGNRRDTLHRRELRGSIPARAGEPVAF